MKNISTWARQHIAEARICIVMLKVLLVSAAFFIGNSLSSMKIILSEAVGIIFIFLSSWWRLYILRVKTEFQKNFFI